MPDWGSSHERSGGASDRTDSGARDRTNEMMRQMHQQERDAQRWCLSETAPMTWDSCGSTTGDDGEQGGCYCLGAETPVSRRVGPPAQEWPRA